jgi:hypothetical protein
VEPWPSPVGVIAGQSRPAAGAGTVHPALSALQILAGKREHMHLSESSNERQMASFAFWNTTLRDLPKGTLITVNFIAGKPIPLEATLPSGEVVKFAPPDMHESN